MTQVYDRQCDGRTKFQKELHTPLVGKDGEHDMSTISSLCLQKPEVRCFWYSNVPRLMEQKSQAPVNTGRKSSKVDSSSNPSKLTQTTWSFDESFHYVVAGYARRIIPQVCVAEKYRGEYRICWPHNPGTSNILDIIMKTGKASISSASLPAINCYLQFFNANGTEASVNMDVCNFDSLEEWTDCLHAAVANFEVPLPYNTKNDTKCGFPLWRYEGSDNLRVEVREELSITRILRMQHLNDAGVWEPCSVDLGVLEKCDELLPATEMYCSYTYNTDQELKMKRADPEPYRYFYKDFVTFSTKNVSGGDPQSITIITKSPVEALYWVSENTSMEDFNVRSNYSTDPECVYSGGDPISLSTLKYGNDALFEQWTSDHFSQSQPRCHSFSIPHEPGYHMFAFGNDPHLADPDVGLVFPSTDAGNLSVEYNKVEGNEYILHVIARITRCITFEPTNPGEDDTSYKKTIEVA